MRLILFLITFLLVSYTPGNDRILDADQVKVLNSTYVTLKNDIDMDSNNIFGINNLTVLGITTLDPLLSGPLKATAGVVSSGAIDLTSEVSGVLPIANGGTNSSTALVNDKIMYSSAGAITESTISPSDIIINPLTTDGDILYFNSASPQRLAIGTNGQILTVVGGLPQYAEAPVSTTLTTKGEMQGFSTVNASVGPCLDNEILLYDSAQATGWKCSALPSTSPTVAIGDIIYNNTGTAAGDTNLNIGTESQLLTVESGVPVWKDAPVSLPDQTAQGGNYLTTDGANASWNNLNTSTQIVKDNLLECPTFQGCSPEGVITNGAGIDLSGPTTRAVEVPAFNGSKLNLTQSAAGTLDYTYTKTASFDGKQMVTYCEIRTANTGVTFNSMVDGVIQDTLSVSSTDTWKYYKLPFVGGATSQGFKIDHVTATEIPNIDIANCFIGKDANQIREISGASFVGSVKYSSSNCYWVNTTPTMDRFTSNSVCIGSVTGGGLSLPDVNIPAIKIQTPRVDGYYKVSLTGLMQSVRGTSTTGVCRWGLSSDASTITGGNTFTYSSSDIQDETANISAMFKFNDTSPKTIELMAKDDSSSGSGECRFFGRDDNISSNFDVTFFPDDTSTIVTQNTELTAKTANEFSASINDSGSAVDNLNYDGWLSCTDGGTGIQTCTYGDIDVTEKMSCVVTVDRNGSSDFYATVDNSTATGFTIKTYNQAGTLGSRSTSVHCSKQGADVNKSQTIVGNFKNVNSSEIEVVSAGQTVSQSLPNVSTTTIIFNNEKTDIYNSYDNTTGVFTATKAGEYKIDFQVMLQALSASATLQVDISFNNVSINASKFCLTTAVNFFYSCGFSKSVKMAAGDNIRIKVYHNTGASRNTQNANHQTYLKIVQSADYESVIANLSKQKTKCQTKHLTANVTSNGVMSDLTFSNLVTGKRYRLDTLFHFAENGTTINVKEGNVNIASGFNLVKTIRSLVQNSGYYRQTPSPTYMFVSDASTITFTATSMTNMLISAIAPYQTEVTLCELPDSVISTTEF